MGQAVTTFIAGTGAAFAQPDSKGQGKGQGSGQSQGQSQGQGQGQAGGQQGSGTSTRQISISERDRNEAHSYYRGQIAAGNCPPGLAKKNNGCLPPGQAKKAWTMNQPLPAGVAYEALLRDLLRRLSPAPTG